MRDGLSTTGLLVASAVDIVEGDHSSFSFPSRWLLEPGRERKICLDTLYEHQVKPTPLDALDDGENCKLYNAVIITFGLLEDVEAQRTKDYNDDLMPKGKGEIASCSFQSF